MPGKYNDSKGNVVLMNTMCDMSQFVFVVPDEYSTTLADGNPFKGDFVTMCKALDLNYDILAKRNHKGLLVENFHRFFKKVTKIAVEDRHSNNVFVPTGMGAGVHRIVPLLMQLISYVVPSLLAVNSDSQLILTYSLYLN